MVKAPDRGRFLPVLARTRSIRRPVGPIIYDCLKLVFVRSGSAIVFSEFGHQPVSVGDAILIGPNVLFSAEPEDYVTLTAIYVDTDFALDQFFWQHSTVLHDRLDAQGFAEKVYSEPAQVLRLGRDRAGMVTPWLDEMVALSIEGCFPQRFNRLQAPWFAVMDAVAPHIRISPVRLTPLQRARSRPVLPRTRRFAPLRREAMLAREALHEQVAHSWTLGESDVPVAAAGRRVGWSSRSRATEAFIEHTGLSPSRYRAMRPVTTDHPRTAPWSGKPSLRPASDRTPPLPAHRRRECW